jgi:hypothetical protein
MEEELEKYGLRAHLFGCGGRSSDGKSDKDKNERGPLNVAQQPVPVQAQMPYGAVPSNNGHGPSGSGRNGRDNRDVGNGGSSGATYVQRTGFDGMDIAGHSKAEHPSARQKEGKKKTSWIQPTPPPKPGMSKMEVASYNTGYEFGQGLAWPFKATYKVGKVTGGYFLNGVAGSVRVMTGSSFKKKEKDVQKKADPTAKDADAKGPARGGEGDDNQGNSGHFKPGRF